MISLVAKTSTNTAATTSGIDTTGANLIVIGIAIDSGTIAAPTDNKGNTYTLVGTGSVVLGDNEVRLYQCLNPTVGSGHTFSQADSYGIICVSAWSGVATSSALDQNTGNTQDSGTSMSTGSVTPTQDNELVITQSLIGGTNSNHAIDGGFTLAETKNGTASARYGGAMGYLIQTTAAAANPSWSWTGTVESAARIATFKAQPEAPSTAVQDVIDSEGIIPYER